MSSAVSTIARRDQCDRLRDGDLPHDPLEDSEPFSPSPRPQDLLFDRGDHVEVAQSLIESLRAKAETVYTDGAVYRYRSTDGAFSTLKPHDLSRRVQTFAGVPAGPKGVPLRLRASDVAGAIRLAHDQIADDEFFAGGRPGVAFADVFVEVTREGIIRRPHSPAHRARWSYSFAYVDGQEPLRWLSFLSEIWRDDKDAVDKTALIQEYVGVSLLGIATRFQKAVVQIGDGANGKSALVSVIEACMPPGSVSCIAPQDIGQEYRRHLLAGKLVNIVSELPEADILDSESWKATIDGSSMTAREIRRSPYTFRPIAGHIYSANRLPGTTDQTHGFWRRLIVLSFNRVFSGHEQIIELDKNIVADERAQIVSWALRGAQRAIAAGRLTAPSSSEQVRDAWRKSADQVAAFVDEECTRLPPVAPLSAWTPARAIYQAYRWWAGEQGHGRLAANKFGERMRLLGIGSHRTMSARVYPVRLTSRA